MRTLLICAALALPAVAVPASAQTYDDGYDSYGYGQPAPEADDALRECWQESARPDNGWQYQRDLDDCPEWQGDQPNGERWSDQDDPNAVNGDRGNGDRGYDDRGYYGDNLYGDQNGYEADDGYNPYSGDDYPGDAAGPYDDQTYEYDEVF